MFKDFKEAISEQFEKMKPYPLYRTEVEKELLWITYIESFPPGSNPKMRERTEHDYQACKSFVRAVGNMVAIIEGELVSIWDCKVGPPYNVVAAALSELAKSAPIRNVLLHDQHEVGVDKNFQKVEGSREVITWEHFHLVLPTGCVVADRGAVYGDKQATREVFLRALEEISIDSLETVIDLIGQGSLYRGEEHLHAVRTFLERKKEYNKLTGRRRELFSWRQDLHPSITRIRDAASALFMKPIRYGCSRRSTPSSFARWTSTGCPIRRRRTSPSRPRRSPPR